MRTLQITVEPTTGGFKIEAIVFEVDQARDAATAKINTNVAVASTFSQIPTRIKSLVDVAKEHMQPRADA